MRQLIEYAKMAFRNISANKTRSILTMLGIIIGIGSVIMVLSVGGGGQKMMNDQLGSLANGSIYVMMGGEDITMSDYFTGADVDAVRGMNIVSAATMSSGANGSIRGTKEEFTADISSGNGDYALVFPTQLESGRMWDKADYEAARRVVTLDSNGAKALFGTDRVLGMTVQITVNGRTSDFTIVGITKSQSGYSYNRKISVSLTMPITALNTLGEGIGAEPFYQIALLSTDTTQSAKTAQQVVNLLEARHGNAGRNCYSIIDVSQYAGQISTVTSTFTGIIAAIAGISLLVGGIGVMNIMLVSVTERTREIGIRKALGAKTGSITIQFLIEAGTLTLFGGIIGILLGLWGGGAISGLLGISGYVAPTTVVGIALFSIAIGIFFGIYPARKAAKLSPIEALRNE